MERRYATPRAQLRRVAASLNGILYVIGGYPYTSRVWAYDPRAKTWSARAAMPQARTDMGVAVLNGTIYVIGGNARAQNRINTVESYNPATNTWTEQSPLPIGKSEPAVALVGNLYTGFSIVAADGYTTSGDVGDTEGYNAITNSWTSLTSDPSPRNAACSGRIEEGMYIAGGYLGYGSALSLNESFMYFKNAWHTLAPMPQPALFAGSTVYQGKLYCVGGSQMFATGVLNNLQIYQP